MKFRIIYDPIIAEPIEKAIDELTVPEKLELIKQLCPRINSCAIQWLYIHKRLFKPNGYEILREFLDYLTEQMEVQKQC